jgi:hypothetical protein
MFIVQASLSIISPYDVFFAFQCTGKFNQFWKTTKLLKCNIGGLAALVFIMQRTDQVPK